LFQSIGLLLLRHVSISTRDVISGTSVLGMKGKSPRTTTLVTAGRMDIGAVIRSSLEAGHQIIVLVCGPGTMADEVTRQVVNCVKDSFRVDLVEEVYAW
jgi:hypothetical protein